MTGSFQKGMASNNVLTRSGDEGPHLIATDRAPESDWYRVEWPSLTPLCSCAVLFFQ